MHTEIDTHNYIRDRDTNEREMHKLEIEMHTEIETHILEIETHYKR